VKTWVAIFQTEFGGGARDWRTTRSPYMYTLGGGARDNYVSRADSVSQGFEELAATIEENVNNSRRY